MIQVSSPPVTATKTNFNMDYRLWRQHGRGIDPTLADVNGGIPVRPSSTGIGISIDLPVSMNRDPNAGPIWNGYLVTEITDNMKRQPSPKPNNAVWNKLHQQTLLPSVLSLDPIRRLVYEFSFVASDGASLNYMSDIDNTDMTNQAGFRPFIKQNEWFMMGDSTRWWNTQRWTLENTNGLFRLDVPLDPGSWFNVNGANAVGIQDYLNALARPTYIGLTFGGGVYAGHGVNVYNGNACLQLNQMYTY